MLELRQEIVKFFAPRLTLNAMAEADDLGKILHDGTQILLKDKDTVDHLATLYTALRLFGLERGERIHIIASLYGDLSSISQAVPTYYPGRHNGSRWCDATGAFRHQCERKPDCTPPPLKDACGYDPDPLDKPSEKGVVLFYRCFDNRDEEIWQRSIREVRPITNNDLPAVLQSEQQSFACSAPPGQVVAQPPAK